jgi:hypothetical protein
VTVWVLKIQVKVWVLKIQVIFLVVKNSGESLGAKNTGESLSAELSGGSVRQYKINVRSTAPSFIPVCAKCWKKRQFLAFSYTGARGTL